MRLSRARLFAACTLLSSEVPSVPDDSSDESEDEESELSLDELDELSSSLAASLTVVELSTVGGGGSSEPRAQLSTGLSSVATGAAASTMLGCDPSFPTGCRLAQLSPFLQ